MTTSGGVDAPPLLINRLIKLTYTVSRYHDIIRQSANRATGEEPLVIVGLRIDR